MVYQWTNFVWETNAWWLRRVRPLMALGGAAFFGFFSLRYYFFGKWQYWKQRHYTEEELKEQAAFNKRNWGYDAWYKPTLQKSRKLLIQHALGDNYVRALSWEEMYMEDCRSLEDQLKEQNEWEQPYDRLKQQDRLRAQDKLAELYKLVNK